jgi:hypothetical protein
MITAIFGNALIKLLYYCDLSICNSIPCYGIESYLVSLKIS